MKKTFKIIIALISIALILLVFSNNSFAIENLNYYNPEPSLEGSEKFVTKAGTVLGTIRTAGIIISILALAIIGLKYMFTSAQERADYKKEMIPFIVGCFMLMGVSALVGLIEQLNL